MPTSKTGLCCEPAVVKIKGIEHCRKHLEAHRLEEKRSRYGCVAVLIPANERVMAKVYKMATEGKAPEVIAKYIMDTTGHTMAEWAKVEEYVLAVRKMRVWLVWGVKEAFIGGHREFEMLVLEKSAPGAKKLWREELYKHRTIDIPNECRAVQVTKLEKPMVLAQHVDSLVGVRLDMQEDEES